MATFKIVLIGDPLRTRKAAYLNVKECLGTDLVRHVQKVVPMRGGSEISVCLLGVEKIFEPVHDRLMGNI